MLFMRGQAHLHHPYHKILFNCKGEQTAVHMNEPWVFEIEEQIQIKMFSIIFFLN